MFISFEGIDTSGKTTQILKLQEYFIQRGRKVTLVRDPGGTKVSEEIRKILLSKENLEMVKECEILLFSASRSQMVSEIILPNLALGNIILADRFFDSTTAYQGFGRGISIDVINILNKVASRNTPPDLTFFIDISYEESRKRQEAHKMIQDRMESADKKFFDNVREGYYYIAKSEPSRFYIIDGTEPKESVHSKIVSIVERHVK